jgi:hypothetical protein
MNLNVFQSLTFSKRGKLGLWGRGGPLQCLTNLDLLPPTGALLVAAPLRIRQGSGSPLRVLALVETQP